MNCRKAFSVDDGRLYQTVRASRLERNVVFAQGIGRDVRGALLRVGGRLGRVGSGLLAEHFGIAGLERPRQTVPAEQSGGSGQGTLEDLEQRAVAEALARHNGNIRAASRALGVSRPTLYRKLKKMADRD